MTKRITTNFHFMLSISHFRAVRTVMAWRSGSVMHCHAPARGSNPGGSGVKTELHVLRKGQWMGVPSLNDLAVDGT